MSIIIYHENGRREIVASKVTLEQAVEIRSHIDYHFSRTAAERAVIVPDNVAEEMGVR